MPAPGTLPGSGIEFSSNLLPVFLHKWQALSIHNLSNPLSLNTSLILTTTAARPLYQYLIVKLWFVISRNECCSCLIFVEWQNEIKRVGSTPVSVPEMNCTRSTTKDVGQLNFLSLWGRSSARWLWTEDFRSHEVRKTMTFICCNVLYGLESVFQISLFLISCEWVIDIGKVWLSKLVDLMFWTLYFKKWKH